MRRIRTIAVLRRVLGSLSLRLLFALSLLGILVSKISLSDVLANFIGLKSVSAYSQFAFAAFAETSVVVQIVSVGFIAALLWSVNGIRRMGQDVSMHNGMGHA
jgi:hypothetical protein